MAIFPASLITYSPRANCLVILISGLLAELHLSLNILFTGSVCVFVCFFLFLRGSYVVSGGADTASWYLALLKVLCLAVRVSGKGIGLSNGLAPC